LLLLVQDPNTERSVSGYFPERHLSETHFSERY